jgi:hypothetical protein
LASKVVTEASRKKAKVAKSGFELFKFDLLKYSQGKQQVLNEAFKNQFIHFININALKKWSRGKRKKHFPGKKQEARGSRSLKSFQRR